MKNNGFTLIELLVVVLIIGVLSAVALPQYQKVVDKAKMAQMDTIVDAARKSVQAHVNAHGYPTGNNTVYFTGTQGVSDIEMPGDCNSDEFTCYTDFAHYQVACEPDACWIGVAPTQWKGDEFSIADEGEGWQFYDHAKTKRGSRVMCEWASERNISIAEGCEDFLSGQMSDEERECREGGGTWLGNGCGWK